MDLLQKNEEKMIKIMKEGEQFEQDGVKMRKKYIKDLNNRIPSLFQTSNFMYVQPKSQTKKKCSGMFMWDQVFFSNNNFKSETKEAKDAAKQIICETFFKISTFQIQEATLKVRP